MTNCDNCNKRVTKKREGLQCLSCGIVVHASQACSGLTGKQLSAFRNADTHVLEWTSHDCRINSPDEDDEEDEDVLVNSKVGSNTLDCEKFLKEIIIQMKKVLKKELVAPLAQMGFCCKKIFELTKTVELINKRIVDLEKKFTYQKNEKTHLELEMNSLRQYVINIEQQHLENVLEVSGVPDDQVSGVPDDQVSGVPDDQVSGVPDDQGENLSNCSKIAELQMMKDDENDINIKHLDGRNGQNGIIQGQSDKLKLWNERLLLARRLRARRLRARNLRKDGVADFTYKPSAKELKKWDLQDTREMREYYKTQKCKKEKKRRRDESREEEVPASSKKKSKTELSLLKKRLKSIMQKVIEHSDEGGRVLSEPFMKLPSRREMPDYYDVIKVPLDINKIMIRMENGKYTDITDLERDFITLCANAQTYNAEDSLTYKDAVRLRNVFIELRRKYENGQNSDESEDEKEKDEEDSDGETSRSMKMKIKLKRKGKSTPTRKRKLRKYISDDEDFVEDSDDEDYEDDSDDEHYEEDSDVEDHEEDSDVEDHEEDSDDEDYEED